MTKEFTPFPKIPRLSREIIISEKIDGTNARVAIEAIPEDIWDIVQDRATERASAIVHNYDGYIYVVFAGSKNRWIVPGDDNFGFAKWVSESAPQLIKLGEGEHHGEWYGKGIQRGYGLDHKRFALFNTGRWYDTHNGPRQTDQLDEKSLAPECCHVVPVLATVSEFDSNLVDMVLHTLGRDGSTASPGFMNPEGVIVFHPQSRQFFKKTLDNNDGHKDQAA